jgi:polysaccharide biosynthesis transport protein
VAQYELNLRDYLRIFRKHKFVIIITFLGVMVLSMFFVPKESIIYKATATIKIEERKTIAGLLTEELVFNPADVMESETKLIKGFPVMKQVALRMGLITTASSLEDVNEVVAGLQDEIETERMGSTNMITIAATSHDPRRSMELANAVAQVYIEENQQEKAKQSSTTRRFIEEQLVSLEQRLKKSEEDLRQFGEVNKNIKLAQPIEQKMVELQFQLAELLQKYTDKHPRVIQLKSQIQAMESQISGFSGRELEYARLEREVEVNKKLYSMLKEKLEESRITEAQKVSDVSVVNPAVFPGASGMGNAKLRLLVSALLGLVLGLALAFTLETLDTSIATIEDVENVIKLPVLGIIPSFDMEAEPKSFLDSLKARLMPKDKTEDEQAYGRLISHYKPHSPVTEAYRNFYTNLKLNAGRKTVLITSSSPQEGKSSIACNLGIVTSQVGLKTVLVSTDLRRPVLAKTFGVNKEPGLNELLTGTAQLDAVLKNITDIILGEMKFEDVRKTPGIENIWIIPSGALPVNPVELLESKAMEQLIETLRSQFEVIIFDAPPVLPVTDASMLAPKMDCTVIAYEIGRTSREALLRTKIQLEAVGAKIAGVVLNHTRAHTETFATYPYYRNKYRYYGQPDKLKSGNQGAANHGKG